MRGLGLGIGPRGCPWTPTRFGSALRSWGSADGPGVSLVSGAVASVTDRANSSIVWSQGTPTKRFVWRAGNHADAINGLAVFDCDGVDDFLSTTSLSATAGDVMIGMVLRPTNTANIYYTLDSQTGRLFTIVPPGGPYQYYDGSFRNTEGDVTTAAQALIFDLRTSPGGRVYRDGAQVGVSAPYVATALGGTTVLGATFVGLSNWFQGQIAEWVIVSGQTDAMRDSLMAYLRRRSGT